MKHPNYQTWSMKWMLSPVTDSRDSFYFERWIDPDWRPADLVRLLRYLKSAPVLIAGLTPMVQCSFCPLWLDAPANWRWDGTWMWPHDLPHFMEAHSMRLPDLFVQHIRERDYILPEKSQLDRGKGQALYEEMCLSLDEV